jgi:hypothetical protein
VINAIGGTRAACPEPAERVSHILGRRPAFAEASRGKQRGALQHVTYFVEN